MIWINVSPRHTQHHGGGALPALQIMWETGALGFRFFRAAAWSRRPTITLS
ncbi:hypothetical protein GDI3794 [Gluconacetobacter diazotrophicus PA1 5]|uniref:Uncharacterized protein n=1 Tax=Gluconacetobacter diazotrophicus (strain ATCC 49037 / DSM 5601 / CCUG 37298 / CIP 103539 / LMG 7603 / PAl5) TaxID=272568 RepID=A9H9Q0_GLUDA|nr:hypothetical protein GDI3794 [Gluconacetobacter diazotrophicus PA1 5]